ncbi:MAG: GNAT family N-acetyltransferase [Candidatus Bathyarchaeia archaeon]
MEFRRLTIKDYEALIHLWTRSGLPYKPLGRDSKKSIAAQMKANPQFFIGAFEENRLVGAVIVSCDMRKGWINRLAVDPEFRRKGIAKALIAESERVLREMDIRIFCALIEDCNVASKALFKKCGYVEHHNIIYFTKRDNDQV